MKMIQRVNDTNDSWHSGCSWIFVQRRLPSADNRQTGQQDRFARTRTQFVYSHCVTTRCHNTVSVGIEMDRERLRSGVVAWVFVFHTRYLWADNHWKLSLCAVYQLIPGHKRFTVFTDYRSRWYSSTQNSHLWPSTHLRLFLTSTFDWVEMMFLNKKKLKLKTLTHY